MTVGRRLRDLDDRVMGETDSRQRRRFALVLLSVGVVLYIVGTLLYAWTN